MRTSWIGPRGRNILHVGSWSLAAKAAAAANLFLPIPFVLADLGPAQFGVWVTLVSLTTLAGFLDFGFSNGAMNLIAAAHARGSASEVATIVREAILALSRIAVWLVLPVLAALAIVPWHHLFGLPETLSGECRGAVAAILLSILAAIPLDLSYRAQLGLRVGQKTFRWQAIGQLAAMASVIGLAKLHAPLAVLTTAAVAAPTLASLANTHLLLRHESVRNAPLLDSAQRARVRRNIQGEGVMFFVLQLAAALAFTSDLVLISSFRGPEEAGHYAIAQRLFSVIPLAFSLIWAPLWPTYRHSLAVGDQRWAMRTLSRSVVLAISLSSVAALTIALGFHDIVGLWVRAPFAMSGLLIAGFAAWAVTESAGTAIATFLNAASVLKFQLVTACVFAVACVTGKVLAISHGYVEVVPWVTLATYLSLSMLPFLLYRRRIFASVFQRKY